MRSMEPVKPEGALWEALPMDEGLLARHLAEADLLVNTTSLGMSPNVDASPLPDGIVLRPECGVADMIYSPPKTKLILTAEARGCRTTSGHLMLLHQAVEAFKFWTGVDPDVCRHGRRPASRHGGPEAVGDGPNDPGNAGKGLVPFRTRDEKQG